MVLLLVSLSQTTRSFFLRVPTTNNTGQNTSLFINPERPRTILGMPDSPVCILFFQSFSSSQHPVSYTKIQSGSFEVPVLHLLCLRMDSFTRKKEKQKKKCQSKCYCSFFSFFFSNWKLWTGMFYTSVSFFVHIWPFLNSHFVQPFLLMCFSVNDVILYFI